MSKIRVIKIGGALLESEELLEKCLTLFSKLPGKNVMVHGGGRSANQLADKVGIKPYFIGGRRVTDKDMLEVVVKTFSGEVNTKLVAKMQGKGCNAIGLTGADGDLIRAHKRPPVDGHDFGFVGDIDTVKGELLVSLLEASFIPVIAPLSHDGAGQLLNTNADTIASEIATALVSHYDEVELYYLFELEGVLHDRHDVNSVMKKITANNIEDYKSKGIIKEGMLPKLHNAVRASQGGVKKVKIVHYSALESQDMLMERGTLVSFD